MHITQHYMHITQIICICLELFQNTWQLCITFNLLQSVGHTYDNAVSVGVRKKIKKLRRFEFFSKKRFLASLDKAHFSALILNYALLQKEPFIEQL